MNAPEGKSGYDHVFWGMAVVVVLSLFVLMSRIQAVPMWLMLVLVVGVGWRTAAWRGEVNKAGETAPAEPQK